MYDKKSFALSRKIIASKIIPIYPHILYPSPTNFSKPIPAPKKPAAPTAKPIILRLTPVKTVIFSVMPKPFERAVESMASMNITVYITCQALPRRDTIVSIGISPSGILPQYMLITAHTSTIMHRKNPPESMPTIFASFLFVILLLASDRITTAVSIL